MEAITSADHNLWCNIDQYVKERMSTVLTNNGFIVEQPNLFLDPCEWDKTLCNKSIALILFGNNVLELAGSAYWSKSFIDDLEVIANEYNNKFTLITDHILLQSSFETNNIKVITPPQLFGMYYNNEWTPQRTPKYSKLYNLLLQRTTLFRLGLFSTINDNDLLDQGHVSCLGYQIDDSRGKDATDVVDNIIKSNNFQGSGYTFDGVLTHTFPYKNFKEPRSLFNLEEDTKYSIVFETYNDSILMDAEWLLFTEKTMRSIQVPNISLLLNTSNASTILQSHLNLKVHPINHILDRMPDCVSQAEFIVGLLQNDILSLNDEAYSIAMHNISILKNYYEQLHTDEFYNSIVKQII